MSGVEQGLYGEGVISTRSFLYRRSESGHLIAQLWLIGNQAIRIFLLSCMYLFIQGQTGVFAQMTSITFHQLDISGGLNDGIVRCIEQDKYGYIWVGTVGALNRFDGSIVDRYTYTPDDSFSINNSQPKCMYSDNSGRFWIGTEAGLMEYDFRRDHFLHYSVFRGISILGLLDAHANHLLVNTRQGLFLMNKATQNKQKFLVPDSLLRGIPGKLICNDMCKVGQKIYMATNKGMFQYDVVSEKLRVLSLTDTNHDSFTQVEPGEVNTIWMLSSGTGELLAYILDKQGELNSAEPLSRIPLHDSMNVVGMVTDKQGGIWLATRMQGLLYYNSKRKSFTSFYANPIQPNGPVSNSYRIAYKDRNQIIWLGCDVEGVTYFKPGNNLFSSILPFPDGLQRNSSRLGRALTIDTFQNIWMGNHDGLSMYNRKTGKYRVWKNIPGNEHVIYSNTIRSLHCDHENNIWIGTGSGVNRYHSATQRMEFIPYSQLPGSWYNAINQDKSGNIWFCTNDSSCLYWYSFDTKQFSSIAQHPCLKKYAGLSPTSYVMEDSRQRLWISFSRKGVVMFDKRSNQDKHYMAKDYNKKGLIGNQIIDIKEDKKGVIWMSTFNGLSGWDPVSDSFQSFNMQHGFTSSLTSSLAIDSHNRIWIGVNGALVMIEQDRKTLKYFTESDGLPSVGFHEHAALVSPSGEIWMPTYTGYFGFDPMQYQHHASSLPFYIPAYAVFEKQHFRIDPSAANEWIHLTPEQNSFTFRMVALNFLNPQNTWFAYKLEGFEDNWHYTKDPKAVYTNVPGGRYRFLYKACGDNSSWSTVKPKQLNIWLETVYYKQWWFSVLILAIIIFLILLLMRYRSRQQQKVFALTERAQTLEKDKAMVMYENLKQQLNPHFLFNSLSSLKSLIRVNGKEAISYLDNLSKTYRYILKSRDNETTTLSAEISFTENYIALHKPRYGDGFEVKFAIDEHYLSHSIVPVTVQNLIENAMKHNVIDQFNPLIVNVYTEGEYLVVSNNLQKKSIVETSNKLGLSQLQNLYTYLSARPVEIIESEKAFTVKVPLI